MRLKKKCLSLLLVLCMALTLLPTSAAAREWYEKKQLQFYDSSGQIVHFEDGDNYPLIGQVDVDLRDYPGAWFLCRIAEDDSGSRYVSQMIPLEPTAGITILVNDVELNGDTLRTSGSGDAFESKSSFTLPMTLTIANTVLIPEELRHELNEEELTLELQSIELRPPRGFVAEWDDENQSSHLTLKPGEKRDYKGTLKWDTSYVHMQNGSASYTIKAIAKSETDVFTGEGTFRVSISEANPGEGIEYEGILFPYLDNVNDTESAVSAVKKMTGGMTSEQRYDPTGIDLATLYAEAASARAVRKSVSANQITVNAAAVADLEDAASQASGAVESALESSGVTTARYLANTVTLSAGDTGKVAVKIDPDILTTDVDRIRIETSTYALTLRVSDLAEDLKEPLTITAEVLKEPAAVSGVGAGSSLMPGNLNTKTTVKIDLPKVSLTNPITVSLPRNGDDTTYQALVRSDGSATASKFNPATITMDGKVNSSGTYTVRTNEKDFTDISTKSAEMQKAIRYLTSKGIINGTSATKFSPDNSISRQQIAALLMRALGKVDNTATTTFTDVPKSSSLYHAIASSQKHKVINGYSDNTFRGGNVISKAQIVTVSGRVLVSEMNYEVPADTGSYLGKYKDTVPEYAQSMVALATREGLVVYRTDGTFSGAKNMTRGDAAIILYRLFQRIW